MTKVVRQGSATARSYWAHTVHVKLRSDRWYWYRSAAGGERSPTGRTRILPVARALPEQLRFAFASCQKYEVGYDTAYEHMVREDLDLIAFRGDYIYESADAKDAAMNTLYTAMRQLQAEMRIPGSYDFIIDLLPHIAAFTYTMTPGRNGFRWGYSSSVEMRGREGWKVRRSWISSVPKKGGDHLG